jgi:predicted ATPase
MRQTQNALIRDAAYDALLKSRRKELRRVLARTLDEKFRELGRSQPIQPRH